MTFEELIKDAGQWRDSEAELERRDMLNSCAEQLENALQNTSVHWANVINAAIESGRKMERGEQMEKALKNMPPHCDHVIGFMEPIGNLLNVSVKLVSESWKEQAEKELKPGREMLSLWEFCPLCGKQINPLPAASAEQYETAERLRKLAHPKKQ